MSYPILSESYHFAPPPSTTSHNLKFQPVDALSLVAPPPTAFLT